MTTEHRGHRIEVINAGLRGWVAYVDMHKVGIGLIQQDAHDFARRWIDDEIWKQFMRAPNSSRPEPPAQAPALRLVHDVDRDARMEAGIGRPADEFGPW